MNTAPAKEPATSITSSVAPPANPKGVMLLAALKLTPVFVVEDPLLVDEPDPETLSPAAVLVEEPEDEETMIPKDDVVVGVVPL